MTRRTYGAVKWFLGVGTGALFFTGHWILALVAMFVTGLFILGCGIEGW